MSARTKQFIVWVRRVLLGLRVIQLLAAAGVLVLMILITEVHSETSWLLRVLVRNLVAPQDPAKSPEAKTSLEAHI
ncbi:hypothetical protein IMZ48_38425 [Candidatus Bathyarchaeota archaeon]|nr:hypothetical protein [Candidatus Bathyarchaeota archaeon]